jgi:hypothetical protein
MEIPKYRTRLDIDGDVDGAAACPTPAEGTAVSVPGAVPDVVERAEILARSAASSDDPVVVVEPAPYTSPFFFRAGSDGGTSSRGGGGRRGTRMHFGSDAGVGLPPVRSIVGAGRARTTNGKGGLTSRPAGRRTRDPNLLRCMEVPKYRTRLDIDGDVDDVAVRPTPADRKAVSVPGAVPDEVERAEILARTAASSDDPVVVEPASFPRPSFSEPAATDDPPPVGAADAGGRGCTSGPTLASDLPPPGLDFLPPALALPESDPAVAVQDI